MSSSQDDARRLWRVRAAALPLAALVGWITVLIANADSTATFSAVVLSVVVAVAGTAFVARIVVGLGAPVPARVTARRSLTPRPAPRACDPDRPGPVRPRAPGCGRA